MSLESIEWHTVHSRYIDRSSTVVDLGANYGRFSQAMIERFGCRCVAVEPSPQVCEAIQTHDRLQKCNLAICDQRGPIQFYVRNDPTTSSTVRETGDDPVKIVTVDGIRLEDFAVMEGLDRIDVLKVDIEGAEVGMIDSCSDGFLRSIGQITMEFHDFNGVTPSGEVKRVLDRLRGLGYASFRMSRIGHQDTLLINRTRCPISTSELWWHRIWTRNWRGFLRVLTRWLNRYAQRPFGGRSDRFIGSRPVR